MKRHASTFFLASVAFVACAGWPQSALADPLIEIMGEGKLTFGDNGFAVHIETGTASHLGKFASYAEIEFHPSDEEGALDGEGVIAFVAADGDKLVGVTTWHMKADGTARVTLAWRDAVTFADGTTVASTGRFAVKRPPGGDSSCTYNALTGLTSCTRTAK
jgi:hypothetical protein